MADLVYLDNAATTFPKPESVIDAVSKYIKHFCGNPGRSSHKLAVKAGEAVYEAREAIADFIGCNDPQNIIFTSNATHGLNLVIKGVVNSKCHVIISNREHNSVIRPLYKQINSHGGTISVFKNNANVECEIESLINEQTKALIVNLTSNVIGDEISLQALNSIKRKYGILIIIDASQALGHKPFNTQDIFCDAIVAPGHKSLFGLQGSGFVYLNNDFLKDTLTEGGNGYDTFNPSMGEILPEKYESGTLSTPAIVGLAAGIKYLKSIGVETVEKKLESLTEITLDILSSFSDIKILGAKNGIVSFNYKDYPSNYITKLLDSDNIATRSGYHCAPLIHNQLGTVNQGTVRISLSYLNKKKDLDILYRTLKNELKNL